MAAPPSWSARVLDLDAAARVAAQPGRAEQEKQYLKSGLTHLGCPVPDLRRIVRAVPVADRDDLLGLVDTLWSEPIHERRLAAVMLLVGHQSLLQPGDIEIVETLARQCLTWALLDELAVHAAGPLLDRHPEADQILNRWAVDDDVWIRRAALLAHLAALRAGGGDWDRFTRYADLMLDEREFWIRKAIGWVLRDTGRRRPQLVAAWALPRAARMSGVTRREVAKVVPGI
jgi:3-methyladenine DNA glycosylase AlkD